MLSTQTKIWENIYNSRSYENNSIDKKNENANLSQIYLFP
jgi:hypothetical protein